MPVSEIDVLLTHETSLVLFADKHATQAGRDDHAYPRAMHGTQVEPCIL